MKNIIEFIRKADAFTWFSLISMVLFIYLVKEKGPWTHSIDKESYFFLNSFFGYKFFPKHISFFFSDILILLIFAISVYHNRNRPFVFNGSSKIFLFFILSLVISLCFSPFRIRSSQCLMVFNFFTIFLFFWSLTNMLNEKNIHKYLQIVFLGVFLVSFFEAFVGIYQYFIQKNLGIRGVPEPRFDLKNLGVASFFSEGGCRWIFDNIFNIQRSNCILFRATGTLAHANVYAAFMFFSTLSTLYLYVFSKRKCVFSSLLIFVLLLQIFAMFVSFSRMSIFGFLIVLIILFFLNFFGYFKDFSFEKRRLRYFALWAGGFCLFSSVMLYPQLIQRGGVVSYNQLARESDNVRKMVMAISSRIIKQYPITGMGFDNFLIYKDNFASELERQNSPKIVHNIYFLAAAEEGGLGLVVFLLFIFSIYKAISRIQISCLIYIFLTYFTVILLIGNLDYYLMILPYGKLIFFFPAAILSSLGCYRTKQKISAG